MTSAEMKVIAAAIKAAYPGRVEWDEQSLSLWLMCLSDIPDKTAETAVMSHLMSSKYPPTIAEVRALCAPPELGSGEAWELAMSAVKRYGYYREAEALKSLPEQVGSAVSRFGYQALCLAPVESIGTTRAQFMRIYEQSAEEVKRRKENQIALDKVGGIFKLQV